MNENKPSGVLSVKSAVSIATKVKLAVHWAAQQSEEIAVGFGTRKDYESACNYLRDHYEIKTGVATQTPNDESPREVVAARWQVEGFSGNKRFRLLLRWPGILPNNGGAACGILNHTGDLRCRLPRGHAYNHVGSNEYGSTAWED